MTEKATKELKRRKCYQRLRSFVLQIKGSVKVKDVIGIGVWFLEEYRAFRSEASAQKVKRLLPKIVEAIEEEFPGFKQ